MNLNPVAGIIEAVGSVASDLITTDKERMAADLDAYKAETERLGQQSEINNTDAKSNDKFQSRWRPSAGWACVAGLVYQFLIYPMLTWCWTALQAANIISLGLTQPPPIDINSLLALLVPLLGIGAYRTVEKVKGAN